MEDRYTQPLSARSARPSGPVRPGSTGNMAAPLNAAGNAPSNAPARAANQDGQTANRLMPNTGAMPGGGAAPYVPKKLKMAPAPNAVMPEMTNKPNMGAMPEMMNKPNMGAMPEMMNKPNMGTMPEMNRPQAAMPYTSQKPNLGLMPEAVNKPNVGAAPSMPKAKAEGGKDDCDYRSGKLPPCAPLAVGFVPFQQKNPPKFSTDDALTKGTLFPGLELPWKNTVNKTNPYAGTPLGELMELRFAIVELNLYLDTHPNDKDALDMLKTLNKMLKDGQEKFAKMYDPQLIIDLMHGDAFTWIDNPWPWDFDADKGGGK